MDKRSELAVRLKNACDAGMDKEAIAILSPLLAATKAMGGMFAHGLKGVGRGAMLAGTGAKAAPKFLSKLSPVGGNVRRSQLRSLGRLGKTETAARIRQLAPQLKKSQRVLKKKLKRATAAGNKGDIARFKKGLENITKSRTNIMSGAVGKSFRRKELAKRMARIDKIKSVNLARGAKLEGEAIARFGTTGQKRMQELGFYGKGIAEAGGMLGRGAKNVGRFAWEHPLLAFAGATTLPSAYSAAKSTPVSSQHAREMEIRRLRNMRAY